MTSKKSSKSGSKTRKALIETDILRIEHLREVFDLTRTELMALLMALSIEIDRRYERIYGFLQDNISDTKPTLGLLYALIGRITPRSGAEENIPRPLDKRMYTYFFVRKDDQNGLNSPLILQPMAKKLLLGISDAEEPASVPFRLYEEEDKNIPAFFEQSAKDLAFILSRENKDKNQEKRLYIANQDEETILHLLYQYCREHKESLYVMNLQKYYSLQHDKREFYLSELYLKLKLNNGRLAIRYVPENTEDHHEVWERLDAAQNLLDEIGQTHDSGHIILYGMPEEPGELAALYIPSLKIPDPSVALRTEIWKYFLDSRQGIEISDEVNIPDLADFYEIPYGMIHKAIGHAIATSLTKRKPVLTKKMLLESLHQLKRVDFSGLATYVKPVYTWDDITITDYQREILQTACSRYRLRNRIGEGWGLKSKNAYGNGISVLLYGPPGTGKTMAAQVIANELELPLYRVDISQISSKYIGETEKNMAVIFNAAAKANVILFFDEADALFSKRTEVSDSHDKYANNETAFLLQKIEEYNGLSILATNYYNNFDDAFVRRITYAVHMESPDKETRYTLWTTILPKTTEVSPDIDFRFFADKFELSGSNIKAILYNAAYMAGSENKPVGAEHIVRSLQYEFNKLGKLVNQSDFGKLDVYLR